jgi:release factor glutamine methyltransferase
MTCAGGRPGLCPAKGTALREALRLSIEFLSSSGVADAPSEAEYLLTHVAGARRHELFTNKERRLTASESSALDGSLRRRADGEPAQYITGTAWFMGLPFTVTPDVLIPRPETEIIVEEALGLVAGKGGEATVIDLCTGSGCIAISIATMLPGAAVYATDISGRAIEVARRNAEAHGVSGRVRFLEGDLFGAFVEEGGEGLRGRVDLVVSNPPYVPEEEFKTLAPEVRDHEPRVALIGGGDGLDFIRRIAWEAPGYLCPGGLLLMEIGFGQAGEVRGIFEEDAGYAGVDIRKDYSGIDRVVRALRAAAPGRNAR